MLQRSPSEPLDHNSRAQASSARGSVLGADVPLWRYSSCINGCMDSLSKEEQALLKSVSSSAAGWRLIRVGIGSMVFGLFFVFTSVIGFIRNAGLCFALIGIFLCLAGVVRFFMRP